MAVAEKIKAGIQKRNYSLDIFKLFASFFVIIIHCSNGLPNHDYLVAPARFAVPAFFMISGWYSYNIITNGNYGKILKRILNLLRLFIIAEIVYIIYSMYYDLTRGLKFSEWIIKIFNEDAVRRFFLFNYTQPFGGLWFLAALIYVYIAALVVMKLNKPQLFTVFAFIMAVFLIAQPFIPEDEPLWHTRNFVTMGLPLFSIGFLMKKHEKTLLKIKAPSAAVLTAAGFGITYAEMFILKKLCGRAAFEIYAGSVIIAVFGIILSMKLSFSKKSLFTELLGDATTYIYIFHMLIYNITRQKFIDANINNPLLRFAITVFCSLILAYIISFFKHYIVNFFQKNHRSRHT